jgi:hypothetical protein
LDLIGVFKDGWFWMRRHDGSNLPV